jgi:hypothetical protein
MSETPRAPIPLAHVERWTVILTAPVIIATVLVMALWPRLLPGWIAMPLLVPLAVITVHRLIRGIRARDRETVMVNGALCAIFALLPFSYAQQLWAIIAAPVLALAAAGTLLVRQIRDQRRWRAEAAEADARLRAHLEQATPEDRAQIARLLPFPPRPTTQSDGDVQ